MPLGIPGTSQPMYPTMYATNPSRYPTAPYYQYPPAPGYYPPMPSQSAPLPASSSSAPPATHFVTTSAAVTPTLNMAASNPAGASGAWADEDIERLKRLAEQSRTSGSSNETDWDWVVGQWGNTRTRSTSFSSIMCITDMSFSDIRSFSKRQRWASKKARPVASNGGERERLRALLKQRHRPHHLP